MKDKKAVEENYQNLCIDGLKENDLTKICIFSEEIKLNVCYLAWFQSEGVFIILRGI